MLAVSPLEELSPTTQSWLSSADKIERKRLGQYMTPKTLRDRLLDAVPLRPGMKVLDPGVGTGEFLRSVLEREPNCEVFGWDIDERILAHAKEAVPQAHLQTRDALAPLQGETFDLIIGNPPYFQFKANQETRTRFSQVISGRPNIFALFFQTAIESLREGGQIAFVVPPSMNNGAYFQGLRQYISSTCSIESLEIAKGSHLFEDAQTAVQLIVLTKGGSSDRHTFTRRCPQSGFKRTIFAEDPSTYEELFQGRRSLFELGFEANTGTIVWNQVKDRLRSSFSKETVPLIWAHNLQGGEIVLGNNPRKKQYVVTSRRQYGPAILVNRIVGSVGGGSIRCAFAPENFEFVGENHTNVVTPRNFHEDLVDWGHLLRALMSQETAERVRLLTGNTQVSATELTHLLPIDVR